MAKINLEVIGMHCKSCAIIVTDVLEEIGASKILISVDEKKKIGKVSFEYSGNKNDAIKAIEKEGYRVMK